MVSLNDTFTIIGISNEPIKKPVKNKSMRVNDYIDKIPEIEFLLSADKNALQFFCHLSLGYQKDWARYIFSAKTQKTIEKRTEKMIEVLNCGYKSINLFQRAQK